MPGYQDFIRGLAGAGAAMAGDVPAHERDQERQFRQGAVTEELRLRGESGQRENVRLLADVQKLRSDMELRDVQLAKGYMDALIQAREFYQTLPAGSRDGYLSTFVPFASRLHNLVTRGKPEQGLANPEMISQFLQTPGAWEQYLDSAGVEFTQPQKEYLRGITEPKQRLDAMKTLADEQREILAQSAVQKARGALAGQGAAVSYEDPKLAVLAGWTPQETRAVAWRLATDKDGTFDKLLSSAGIFPPSMIAGRQQAQIEAEKARQIQLGKEGTPGGQAGIAETQANTNLKNVQAAMEPVKVLPAAGASAVRLPLPGQTPQPQAGAAPIQTRVSGGAQVLAETPAPGIGVEASQQITGAEMAVDDLRKIGAILQGGKADSYIGPMFTGARFNEWAAKNLPGVQLPNELAALDRAESAFKNFRIRAITGAAVREAEEPRILSETPDRTRDKPEAYRLKWRQNLENMQVLQKRMSELLGPDGRMRVGADPDAVAKKYPLPAALSSSPRVIRNPKTGQRLGLQPGYDIPEGWEEVR